MISLDYQVTTSAENVRLGCAMMICNIDMSGLAEQIRELNARKGRVLGEVIEDKWFRPPL